MLKAAEEEQLAAVDPAGRAAAAEFVSAAQRMHAEAARLANLTATEARLLRNTAAAALAGADVTRYSQVVHVLTSLLAELPAEEITAAGRPADKTREVVPAAFLYPETEPAMGSPFALQVNWGSDEDAERGLNTA